MRVELARRRALRCLAVATVVCVASRSMAVAAPQTLTVDDPRTRAARPAPVLEPAEELGVGLGRVPQVVLAPPDVAALTAEDLARAARSSDKVLRYGVGRNIAVAERDGVWNALAGGRRLWAIEVGSAGALALRLHFRGALPAGSRLTVVEAASGATSPGLWEASAGTRLFDVWSPSVMGETARVEYLAPPGAGAEALPFRVDRLQHIYVDPVSVVAGVGVRGARIGAGGCHNDVTCHPEWRREARAVAGLGVIGEDSLFCTGQLVNDLAQDFTPYFLTANHCAGKPALARTAELYWFYQTSACGGPPPTLASVPRSSGATLLSAGAASDYALLRVEGRLPHGVAWAGWTASPIEDGTAAAVIHHPSGDFKRISFGDKASALECGGAQHLRIRWTDGPTEDGSSGAGAFRADTHQLFGQLHCGPSACGRETYDQFGSFSATYPRIASLLARGSDDDAEPDDSCAAAHRVTPGTLAGRVVTYRSPDWYRMRVPSGRTLRVTLHFVRQEGTLAALLVGACGQAPRAVASGKGDSRVLELRNAGPTATFAWEVELPDDLRNTYSMTVELL